MGKLLDYLTGRDLIAPNSSESRTIAPGTVSEAWTPVSASKTALPAVSETTALKIADVFSAVRCLADGLSSLPLKPYRRRPDGSRIPAGDDARISRLLRSPAPGQTSCDLISQVVVDLCVHGSCFLAKFRGGDGEIVQVGCLPPDQITVEQRGQRIVYTYSSPSGVSEHGPEDIIAIRGASRDGLRGMSPVRQCGRALAINEGLLSYAAAWLANAGRPSGILRLSGDVPVKREDADNAKQDFTELFSLQAAGETAGKVAVIAGEGMNYEAIEPAMKDQQFLDQREWSVRETARIFGLPPFKLGVSSGDSLTYSSVTQENRAFVDMSLRPMAIRIEKAISNDPDLAAGQTYVQFSFDALLRADTRERYDAYKTAIEAGFMSVEEIRELEDLPRRAD